MAWHVNRKMHQVFLIVKINNNNITKSPQATPSN